MSPGETSPFGQALRELRKARDLSQMELADIAGTSQRHVSFIELGRSVPSRAMVLQIAESLGLTLSNRNRLLVAAGYAPLSVTQLGTWDEALQDVADVLTDARLTAEEREEFRTVVRLISQRWRGRSRLSPELAS